MKRRKRTRKIATSASTPEKGQEQEKKRKKNRKKSKSQQQRRKTLTHLDNTADDGEKLDMQMRLSTPREMGQRIMTSWSRRAPCLWSTELVRSAPTPGRRIAVCLANTRAHPRRRPQARGDEWLGEALNAQIRFPASRTTTAERRCDRDGERCTD